MQTPAPPAPQRQSDIVDLYTNPALVEAKSDTNPSITKADSPQGDVKYRRYESFFWQRHVLRARCVSG